MGYGYHLEIQSGQEKVELLSLFHHDERVNELLWLQDMLQRTQKAAGRDTT
jgi:hypothetical protein